MSRPAPKYRPKSPQPADRGRWAATRGFAAILAGPAVVPEPPAPEVPEAAAAPELPAAPEPVALHWDAVPPCPDADSVRTSMRAYVADPPTTRALRADGTVRADADGFALELVLDDGTRSETRTLRSRDCEALARAAGLVIAVALDPIGVAGRVARLESEVVPIVTPVVDPANEPDRAPEPRPMATRPSRDDRARDPDPPSSSLRRRASPPVRIGVRPELLFGGGILPERIGVGIAGHVAVFSRARPWRVEVGGTYWFARTAEVESAPAAGGRLWLANASVSGCGVPSVRRVEFPICAGPDLGALGGEGFGPGVSPLRETDFWVGAHASAGVAWSPVDSIALFGRVEGRVSLRRPGFHLDDVGDVHRAGAGGAHGAVGLEVRFF